MSMPVHELEANVLTAEQIANTAALFLLHHLGHRLIPGSPQLKQDRDVWELPIFSASLGLDHRLGCLEISRFGEVTASPSKDDIRLAGRRLTSPTKNGTARSSRRIRTAATARNRS